MIESSKEAIKIIIDNTIEAIRNNDVGKAVDYLEIINKHLTDKETPHSRENLNRIKDIVSNPLLFLIIGAILSGLLVPYITNKW